MNTSTKRSAACLILFLLAVSALSLAAMLLVSNAKTDKQPVPSTTNSAPMHPCTSEDGSADTLPCYWDATMHGNGIGQSYIIDADGSTHYTDTGASHSARRVSIDADALRYDVTGLVSMPTCDGSYSVRPCVFMVGEDTTLVMTAEIRVIDVYGRLFLR